MIGRGLSREQHRRFCDRLSRLHVLLFYCRAGKSSTVQFVLLYNIVKIRQKICKLENFLTQLFTVWESFKICRFSNFQALQIRSDIGCYILAELRDKKIWRNDKLWNRRHDIQTDWQTDNGSQVTLAAVVKYMPVFFFHIEILPTVRLKSFRSSKCGDWSFSAL